MADPRRSVRQKLESLQRAGVTSVPKSKGVKKVPAAAKPQASNEAAGATSTVKKQVAATPNTTTTTSTPAAPARVVPDFSAPIAKRADRIAALDVIRAEVVKCMRCPELCTTRTQTVFGVGNPQARLCFVGEAPGADEDKRGEPFVGRAGQLLDKIIEACTLKREDVYILNILRCRPPGNRNPLPEEAANCREFLEAQLAVIRPEFLCCLGAVAARNLLDTETPISQLRGKLQSWNGKQVMCTYHPAYLLRNPDAKRFVWDDMKVLMRAMGIELDKK
jgi:uracil-DNA glycosylase family 4